MKVIEVGDLTAYKHPLYQVAYLDDEGEWAVSFDDITRHEKELESFMLYQDYYTEVLQDGRKTYSPALDINGPLNFYPSQCYKNNSEEQLGNPLIAYVENNNWLE